MGEMYLSQMREMRNSYKMSVGNLKERDHFAGIGVHG
jgi:hypothetical protein